MRRDVEMGPTQYIDLQHVQAVFVDIFQALERMLTCLIQVLPCGCDDGDFGRLKQPAGKL